MPVVASTSLLFTQPYLLFGTSVKFHYPKYPLEKPVELRLYLRADQDIYAITEAILTLLIHNREVGASYDELADLIFDDYDDFSLYAISKAIQRLRDKLEAKRHHR